MELSALESSPPVRKECKGHSNKISLNSMPVHKNDSVDTHYIVLAGRQKKRDMSRYNCCNFLFSILLYTIRSREYLIV